jgi:hypothetical protein
MQTLKVIIPGKFYDSQIYDGRLYLWSIDGSLVLINWDQLVDQITVPEGLEVALKFALQYGDDLYSNLLMHDAKVKNLMQSKFQRLATITVELKKEDLSDCIVNQQDSPLPFPHADSVIHYKTMYVCGQGGVSASKCSVGRGHNQSIKPAEKLFDMPALSISASHLTLAVAAGMEGLFDYSLISDSAVKRRNEPRILSSEHCNLARWLYPSIFGSSYFNNGYFADFKKSKRSKAEKEQLNQKAVQLVFPETLESSALEKGKNQQSTSQYEREFTRLFSSTEIFAENKFNLNGEGNDKNNRSFTWGVQDKICLATNNSITLSQYLPHSRSSIQKFRDIGSVDIEELSGEVVSADSSFFGVVLEKEDGLLVINSSLESHFFDGEPVNWRVFPNSRNYSNQLHIIHEDALHIHSFNHDYFVDQSTKKLGISVTSIKK